LERVRTVEIETFGQSVIYDPLGAALTIRAIPIRGAEEEADPLGVRVRLVVRKSDFVTPPTHNGRLVINGLQYLIERVDAGMALTYTLLLRRVV
jgi:hypothetical protein